MVHEMSGHNTAYIIDRMPLVEVLQFVTLWWEKRGYRCRPIADTSEGMQWL